MDRPLGSFIIDWRSKDTDVPRAHDQRRDRRPAAVLRLLVATNVTRGRLFSKGKRKRDRDVRSEKERLALDAQFLFLFHISRNRTPTQVEQKRSIPFPAALWTIFPFVHM